MADIFTINSDLYKVNTFGELYLARQKMQIIRFSDYSLIIKKHPCILINEFVLLFNLIKNINDHNIFHSIGPNYMVFGYCYCYYMVIMLLWNIDLYFQTCHG